MVLSIGDVEAFERSRGRLEAIAYRMLGSASDAEDIVQDTFLRWQSADREQVTTPAAWLTKVLTNLCLNQLTSARARRETYVGRWLPEPVLAGDPMLGPAETAEQRDSVSIAMLTLMERLSPNERAVYVLREAFGYSHAEIAGILGITEANSQQLFRRAGRHLLAEPAHARTDAAAARQAAEEFLAAALSGDTAALVKLLTADAVSVADGGGRVPARVGPVVGALAIARYLRGISKPSAVRRLVGDAELALRLAEVNGVPALVVLADEKIIGTIVLDVAPDGISGVHILVNPDKMSRLQRQWSVA